MSMNQSSKETVLVTGASGGIGLELARQFAKNGFDLVLAARSAGKLADIKKEFEKQYNVRVSVIVKDLIKPGAAGELFEETKKAGLSIDILVNNAGFGTYGPFAQSDLTKELEMIQLNISALTHLTRLVLPGMLEKKKGRILNVASTAAFQPGPLMAVYYATKAFVLSFTDAISAELEKTGIVVSSLCPGPTKSDFQKTAGLDLGMNIFRAAGIMTSEAVAEVGYREFMKGKRVIIPGFANNTTTARPATLKRVWSANSGSRPASRISLGDGAAVSATKCQLVPRGGYGNSNSKESQYMFIAA